MPWKFFCIKTGWPSYLHLPDPWEFSLFTGSYWIAAKCVPMNLFGAAQFSPSQWNCSSKIPPLEGTFHMLKYVAQKCWKCTSINSPSLKSGYEMSLMISLPQCWLARLNPFFYTGSGSDPSEICWGASHIVFMLTFLLNKTRAVYVHYLSLYVLISSTL